LVGPKIGPGEINVPVCCGGVIVEPGDVITASEGGIAVVPQRFLGQLGNCLTDRTDAPKSADSRNARLQAQDEATISYLDEINGIRSLTYLH
jgi:regulator of RNase E activity RraA